MLVSAMVPRRAIRLFQTSRAAIWPFMRVRVTDHKVEEVVSLKGIKNTGYGGGFWIGRYPGNEPLFCATPAHRRSTHSIGMRHSRTAALPESALPGGLLRQRQSQFWVVLSAGPELTMIRKSL